MDTSLLTVKTSENPLFRGLSPEALPDFMKQRLAVAFERAQALFNRDIAGGNVPEWCVFIEHRTEWSSRHCEWAVYQEEDGMPLLPIEFEKYGYTNGVDAYTVSVVDLKTRDTNLSRACQTFASLNQDRLLLNAARNSSYHGSYYMVRVERDIKPDEEAPPLRWY